VGVTSTVLDGMLCLLLVSAAVVTVTTATPHAPAGAGRAPDVASTLATTTATVNYTVSTDGGDADRDVRGTLAALLARAAVGEAAVGGTRLRRAEGLTPATIRAVRGALRANHTYVTAVWRPYPGASVRGAVDIGARPPPDATVHAATLDVPSGYPARRTAARRAAERGGIDGVARVVADGIVRGLFPPTRTRHAAGGDDPTATVTRRRYRRVARIVDADTGPPADGDVRASNDRLASALADRVARDLRDRNGSVAAAARGVRVGRVRITVRTWP
jgi:hypothetical protein